MLVAPHISAIPRNAFPFGRCLVVLDFVIVRVMISKHEPRMKSIPLNRVAFRSDLPLVLAVGEYYVSYLLHPPAGAKGDWYRAAKFPGPFYVSPSGVRIWWIEDVVRWAGTIRLKATTLRAKRIGTGMDRPEILDLLGL